MEKFKIGDGIVVINPDDNLKKGKIYTVMELDREGDPGIVDELGKMDYHYTNEFKLALRRGKPVKEDLTRYMVYGSGCDNKSDLYMTEKEMTKEAKNVIRDDEWRGEIIGYKLVPIFKVELTAKLKRVVIDNIKKKAKK